MYFVTSLVNGGTDNQPVTTRFGGCALEGGSRLRELCVFGDGADHPLFRLTSVTNASDDFLTWVTPFLETYPTHQIQVHRLGD